MEAIVPAKDFQERMFERIRLQIGDLMTAEDLKKITETAVNRAFFEPRKLSDGYRTVEKPPYFQELMSKLMEDRVKLAVSAWIDEHPKEITDSLNIILAQGMTRTILGYLDSRASIPLQGLIASLQVKGAL